MSKDNFSPLPPIPNIQVGVPILNLYDGLKLKGVKRWRQARQDFEADIIHIDKESDRVYGYLTVKRFEKALKITYFEGEIIGEKHPFLTRKWNADAETDKKHWWKFDCFFKYASFNTEDFDYSCLHGSDHVFMRWKEMKSKDNFGWVAPGFYYVCLTKSTGECDGIYFERTCWLCEEGNQDTFSLKQTPQRSVPVYQFR